jgi:hypothetical protein
LTYISIDDAVKDLRGRGLLFPVHPANPVLGAAHRKVRSLWVTNEVNDLICRPDDEGQATAALLERFASGSLLSVRRKPRRKDKSRAADLAPLEEPTAPHEVFELRVTDLERQIRVLGLFGRCSYFVALAWHYRDDMDERWAEVISDCADIWHQLFGARQPHTGRYPDGYLSDTRFAT